MNKNNSRFSSKFKSNSLLQPSCNLIKKTRNLQPIIFSALCEILKLNIMKTILIFIFLASCQGNVNTNKNEGGSFMPSYKELLKTDSKNKDFIEFFDSTSNIYSNFKYGFSMKFPSNWTIDKGFAEHTIIRGLEEDSAITFPINVFEIKDSGNDDISIWKIFDSNRDLVEKQFKKEMEFALQSAIFDYANQKVYFDNHEAIQREFTYNVKHLDSYYQMKAKMYQVAKPPYVFTIGFHVPLFFFEENPIRYNSIFDGFYFNTQREN